MNPLGKKLPGILKFCIPGLLKIKLLKNSQRALPDEEDNDSQNQRKSLTRREQFFELISGFVE